MPLPVAASVPVEPVPSMYWRRVFPGQTTQVRAARAFAACLLEGFPALDDVLLVLDELAVNALRHTRSGRVGGRFVVEVRHNLIGVTVSVTDQGGPTDPRIRPVADACDLSALAESGRGLLTVEALATAWSWTGTPCSRTVHATFAAPAAHC
ncbi:MULTISPECIES: ATP-binding protein [Thermomonospora]|uniref:Putative anti-sigma regulatory factor, serine/threonine protein kinase n=1 Tax=Thermomonospora curvata (strain ATCC 19995 / DSM 43183 / JCM 3096 / KCTC 9072 / NBRC 15933 / NCIMB 10081 / Henssen B9) TaxID=471852 RepID=D1A9C0_THECD|nr:MULTISPECIES: ATP-binding protein [Thermomonospora]ACY96816.1 putative anti-sigma regulatory factor, serine/threonine protein kinase [Thermomonospora curvata DSM 43183]PKK15111.1 MAG: ATP-binding protein [Thermomonospora sp. CIF 1]